MSRKSPMMTFNLYDDGGVDVTTRAGWNLLEAKFGYGECGVQWIWPFRTEIEKMLKRWLIEGKKVEK